MYVNKKINRWFNQHTYYNFLYMGIILYEIKKPVFPPDTFIAII